MGVRWSHDCWDYASHSEPFPSPDTHRIHNLSAFLSLDRTPAWWWNNEKQEIFLLTDNNNLNKHFSVVCTSVQHFGMLPATCCSVVLYIQQINKHFSDVCCSVVLSGVHAGTEPVTCAVLLIYICTPSALTGCSNHLGCNNTSTIPFTIRGILDLFITKSDLPSPEIHVHAPSISDHSLIEGHLRIQPETVFDTFRTRSWRKFEKDAFKRDLADNKISKNANWAEYTIDELFPLMMLPYIVSLTNIYQSVR